MGAEGEGRSFHNASRRLMVAWPWLIAAAFAGWIVLGFLWRLFWKWFDPEGFV